MPKLPKGARLPVPDSAPVQPTAFPAGTCRVTGALQGPDGAPSKETRVRFIPQRLLDTTVALTPLVLLTDAQGHFAVSLLPGRWRVEIADKAYLVYVRPGVTALDFATLLRGR